MSTKAKRANSQPSQTNLSIRLSADQRSKVETAAEKAGVGVSVFIREAALFVAEHGPEVIASGLISSTGQVDASEITIEREEDGTWFFHVAGNHPVSHSGDSLASGVRGVLRTLSLARRSKKRR